MDAKKPNLLIIDDEAKLVSSLIYGLRSRGIAAQGAYTAATGLAMAAASSTDLVLLDLRLPDASGIDVLRKLKHERPSLPVAVISAHGDIRAAVEAIKLGAIDFVTKPFDLDDIFQLVEDATAAGGARRSVAASKPKAPEVAGFIGASPAVAELREHISLLARSSTRIVLLLGESGTGKGLAARLVHAQSTRARGPFISANCAALPETLMEAELFGAERGAYTGAHQRRSGLVELAEGGTLFLDEIAELPIQLQSKLLHFLESRTFRSLGAARERQADVRIIAATNRELPEEVAQGRFRSDLYYRLNVVPLALPPLANHREDIPALLEHFARIAAVEEGVDPVSFDAGALTALASYSWPGNVRELKHLVDRLTILFGGAEIDIDRLPPEHRGEGGPGDPGDQSDESGIDGQLAIAERVILERALRDAGGRKGKAAEQLGISRHALKRRLQRLNLGSQ